MEPKLYKPRWFAIAIMSAGLAVIVSLKLRKNGWALDGWMDAAFYVVAPLGLALVASLLFSRITIDDEAIEIVGPFTRRRYALADIEQVSTARGASMRFRMRDGRVITMPTWVDAQGWSIAAVLRKRMRVAARAG